MADLVYNVVKAAGRLGRDTLIACGLEASTARKRRRSSPRWLRRPTLFVMAKGSRLPYRATRSCAISEASGRIYDGQGRIRSLVGMG
jgi:hypothetical protein